MWQQEGRMRQMFECRARWYARQQLSALVVLIAVFTASVATVARAQGPATGESIEAGCRDKTSNVELSGCLAQLAAKVDRDLNALWPRVLKTIDDASHLTKSQRADWKAKLTVAQRHWIAFRQADCREPVGYEWFGGTGMGGAVSTCLAKHTLDRIQDLKARYLDR
jgi:uncharacterized protein YecT (DUF1311 family)